MLKKHCLTVTDARAVTEVSKCPELLRLSYLARIYHDCMTCPHRLPSSTSSPCCREKSGFILLLFHTESSTSDGLVYFLSLCMGVYTCAWSSAGIFVLDKRKKKSSTWIFEILLVHTKVQHSIIALHLS